jgi:hypothetical protein
MIRKLITTFAGAALFAGAATVAVAQNWQPPPQGQMHPNTKVYAYQKAAPATTSAPKAKGTGPSVANKPSEHLIGSVPFGSPKWWEVTGRTSGGGEGGN